MSVHATVVTAERRLVLSVPNSALHSADGHTAVTVVDPSGVQHSVSVEAGLVGPDRTEVLSGLNEGDRVAVPDAGK
jgi:multidrug efflux pump subunit AcrA (membrane-fusion protein)